MFHHRALASMAPLLLAGTPLPVRAQPGPGQYGPGMMWDYGWFHMFFGSLMMLVFVAVVVVLVVLAVRWLGGPGHGGGTPAHPPPGRTPLDILRERYARGEIDRQEFEERRRVLGE